MKKADDILELVSEFKARGTPFALATVVRTVSLTAAKAGAKAIITPDGRVAGGWIGGGCARAAVLAAAREALADGKPRLVSIQPKDLLDEQGLHPGEVREGIAFGHYVDRRDSNRLTPLMVASARRELTIARLLLEGGADPRLVGNGGRSAMSFALANDDAGMVALLRRYGASGR